MIDYSWFDQPEFIDIGQLGEETLFYAEVIPVSYTHLTLPTAPYV